MGILSFFKLRARRKATLDYFRRTWPAYVVRKEGWYCYTCREDNTYSIHTWCVRTSPAGEQFTFLNPAIAYMCPRCAAIGKDHGVSSGVVHVEKWKPEQ
jgi:hypothetical protein